MVEREVIWSPTARMQFSLVINYWKQRNLNDQYALKLINEVATQVQLIAKLPNIAQSYYTKDIRRLTIKNYSIIYKVANSKIDILSFWDNRQDPQKCFELLFQK
jgi:plasmid stabilization system protein ParE